MKRLIYTVLCLLALSGCLDDKGNYDYIELNEVNSISGIDKTYTITKFEDVLSIEPEIDFELGESNEYEYEWTVSYWVYNDELRERENFEVLISTERNLEWIANHEVPYDDLFAQFKVKNSSSDVTFKHSFTIRVQNAYQYGYFFLCEDGDANSELFMVRDNGKTIDGLYSQLTGTTLAGKPYCMESVSKGIDNDLVIFTSAGPDYGAIIDIDKMDYRWPAVNCFHEGNVGGNLVVNDIQTNSSRDVYAIVNNHYYFTGGSVIGDYKPYVGIELPDIEETCDYVASVAFSTAFVHGTNPGTVYAPGSWGAIDVVKVEGEPWVLPGKCLFMAAEPGGFLYGPGVKTHFITREEDGMVKENVLSTAMNFSTWSTEHTLIRSTAFAASELVNEETVLLNSYSERYFFFSSDNKIYRYNYDAPDEQPALVVELPVDEMISYMYLDYTQEGWSQFDDRFVVATYDNSANKEASVYFINMDGSIDAKYENVCGKIVDLVVKK